MANGEFQEETPEESDATILKSALGFLALVQKIPVFGPTHGEYFKKAAEILRGEFSDDITDVVAEVTRYDKGSLKTTLFGYIALTLESIGPETVYTDPEVQLDIKYAETIMEALVPELQKWGR